jgi:ABC-2 type transport system permease protein
MEAFEDLEIYEAMGISFGNFDEWVASILIAMLPIILAIYAVVDATGTIAGEEDSGRLELIVALPTPRWQIVTVKSIAHGIALLIILLIEGLVAAIVFLAIKSQLESTMAATDLIWSLLYTWPLVMAFGMISLFLGTFCPRRRVAAMIATVVVLVSYFGNSLSSQVPTLESLQPLFPFYYLDATASLFATGPQSSDVLTLLCIALVAFVLAVFFFQRRDITVGAWPWQRGKLPEGSTQSI